MSEAKFTFLVMIFNLSSNLRHQALWTFEGVPIERKSCLWILPFENCSVNPQFILFLKRRMIKKKWKLLAEIRRLERDENQNPVSHYALPTMSQKEADHCPAWPITKNNNDGIIIPHSMSAL